MSGAKKRRSDRTNYLLLLAAGFVMLFMTPFWGPVGLVCVPLFIGAGYYYWRAEKSQEAGQQPDPASSE